MNEFLISFLAIALIVAIIFFIYIGLFAGKKTTLDKAYYERQWIIITRLIEGSQAELHLAVLEADKLLDKALKERGMPGQTMGDRLKNAKRLLKNNDKTWNAHKLRNRLAHETGVTLKQGEVRMALSGFKNALKDLGAL